MQPDFGRVGSQTHRFCQVVTEIMHQLKTVLAPSKFTKSCFSSLLVKTDCLPRKLGKKKKNLKLTCSLCQTLFQPAFKTAHNPTSSDTPKEPHCIPKGRAATAPAELPAYFRLSCCFHSEKNWKMFSFICSSLCTCLFPSLQYDIRTLKKTATEISQKSVPWGNKVKCGFFLNPGTQTPCALILLYNQWQQMTSGTR